MGSTEEKQSLQPPSTLPQKGVELPPTEFQINPENIIKLNDRNGGANKAYEMVRNTEETIRELTELAKKTGCDIADLAVVWSKIPVENQEGSDSLVQSGEAIIALSDAVNEAIDKKDPDMPDNKRTALKLDAMGDLLKSKARLLDSK